MKREITVAEAYCNDCNEHIGKNSAVNVRERIGLDHPGHDVRFDEWTEVETVECANCDDEATHYEEIALPLGGTGRVPYCDDCGYET